MDDITYHDENTLTKVYRALEWSGLNGQQIIDTINRMQNAGIFFRERNPIPESE